MEPHKEMAIVPKILLFTDWYEPGYKAGGPIQSCRNFVSAMQVDYDIYIVTSAYDLGEAIPYPEVPKDVWTVQGQRVHIFYADKIKISLGMLRKFFSLVKPDYVYLNSMYSLRYAVLPMLLKAVGAVEARMVIAPRGMLQAGALQFKPFKKKIFLQLLNMLWIGKKVTFQATDSQEKKDILQYFPGAAKVVVAPNFPGPVPIRREQIDKQAGSLQCVFISRMAPKKNLLFLLEALQRLRPGTKLGLTLRGEIEDEAYWNKCLAAVALLPENIRVGYQGPIPHDQVTEELLRHHVFILPTLGENFGHAIFEALSAGRPVIISDKTPWRGLEESKTGYDLPLDHAAFASCIGTFAEMGGDEYEEWSKNAFNFAKRYASDEHIAARYKELFA